MEKKGRLIIRTPKKQKEIDEKNIRKIMFALKVGMQGVKTQEQWKEHAQNIYACDDVIV